MTSQNPLTPNTHKSDNDVLDEILGQYSHAGDYGATSGESIIQRYIASLAAREPITIILTIIPVVVLLFAGLAMSGGQKSRTGDETANENSLSETLQQADNESPSIVNLTETQNNSTESENNQSAANTASNSTSSGSSSNTTRQNTTSNTVISGGNGTSTSPTTTINPTPNQTPSPAPITTPLPVDLCLNIKDVQTKVPANYVRDSSGKCTLRVGITPPIATPQPLKLGTLCTIKDGGLGEASGLVASIKHPGIVYTHNDEVGPIYAVSTSTCKVVAKITVVGLRNDADPEGITIDRTTGKIWLGDIGNGHPGQPKSMTDKKSQLKYPKLPARIVVFDEPARLSGNIRITNVRKYDITYQGGMQNAESLLVNPKTGQGYLINKQSTSTVYQLTRPLKSGQARDTGARIPGWVTDATFTTNGNWVLIRYRTATDPAPTKVLVYSASTWKQVGTITVPKVQQGESIAIEKDGRSFIIGSEGKNSPLVRVALPNQYK